MDKQICWSVKIANTKDFKEKITILKTLSKKQD